MKKTLYSILLVLLCLLFIMLPCSSLAQTEEEPQFYDALHINPDTIDLIEPNEGDLIVHRMPHGASEVGETLYSEIKQPNSSRFGDFYVIDGQDGYVEHWAFYSFMGAPMGGKQEDVYPSIEESPLAFFWDFRQNPQKYLKQEVQINELYFLGQTGPTDRGMYIYAVTNKGHFVTFKAPNATLDDPSYVFPEEVFEEFNQIHANEYAQAREEFGTDIQVNEYTFTRVLERKTNVDLTKYHAPFDIDRYKLETTVKSALPIAGAVAVGVVIVVLVVVIAVSKKDGTDESSQAPAESADPTQD